MKSMSLRQLNEQLCGYPISERSRFRIVSFIVGKVVPFFSTAGLKIDKCEVDYVSLSLKNKRKVQNHMGTIHASAIGLLAEATSGLLLNMTLPEQAKYATLTSQSTYIEMARGDLRAEASLTAEAKNLIRESDKGSLKIPVSVFDSQPVLVAKFSCGMVVEKEEFKILSVWRCRYGLMIARTFRIVGKHIEAPAPQPLSVQLGVELFTGF